MNINVLTDYRGRLYSSVKIYKEKNVVSMDLEKLKIYAKDEGIDLFFMHYSDVDLRKDLKGQCFIYTSSEDPMLIYKGYMEDVVYSLQLKGAIMIPDWRYFRAHHNKAMMEMLREVNLSGLDTGIHSRFFGCNEEFVSDIDSMVFPCVYKSAEGAGSKGVALLKDKEYALDFLEKYNINHVKTPKERIKEKIGKAQQSVHSNYRKKFIIQNFIPGLSGDFKVLVFGEKYYALSRQNRDNDFRASGGGKLNYEPELPNGIFDFAKSIYDRLNLPALSLDIAYDGNRFYLIEFQCLHFGTATLENSTHFYLPDNGQWVRHDGPSILEKEFISSLKYYCKKNNM